MGTRVMGVEPDPASLLIPPRPALAVSGVPRPAVPAPELCVVVPVLNECANVAPLVDLLRMLAVLQADPAGPVDIVVGSRYRAGGDRDAAGGDAQAAGVQARVAWSARRASMSGLATQAVLRATVTNPMSGFFMPLRPVFDRAAPRLSAVGFKILLDLLASLPEPPRVRELPYCFRARVAGTSKLDAGVLFDFVLLLLDKLVGAAVPVRFVLFAGIGALGLVAHLMVLRLGLTWGRLGFPAEQTVATACAIMGNFALNNLFTFRDRRLHGARMLRGFSVFSAVCALGAAASLNIASLMVSAGHDTWWSAGVVGAAMSLVWNYAVGSTLTWPKRPGNPE